MRKIKKTIFSMFLLMAFISTNLMAGYSDLGSFIMELTYQTRACWQDDHQDQELPEAQSNILKDVAFIKPEIIAQNRYFLEADAIADQDKLQASKWLISIIVETMDCDSILSRMQCVDACKALIKVHLANAQEHKSSPAKSLNFLMYAAIAADIACDTLNNQVFTLMGEPLKLAQEATEIYKNALGLAKTHNIIPLDMFGRELMPRGENFIEELEKHINLAESSDAERVIYDRFEKFRYIFGSSGEIMMAIHRGNLSELQRKEDELKERSSERVADETKA